MNILLGNTGRGGEQCVFSAIVASYRQYFPQAKITVAICPEFVQMWKSSNVDIITLDHEDPNQPFYYDPVGKWYDVAEKHKKDFDIIEFACEYGFDKAAGATIPKTIIKNIYDRLIVKPGAFDGLWTHVDFGLDEYNIAYANRIHNKYGPHLTIISPISNTAAPVLTRENYQKLANALMKVGPVATTGRRKRDGSAGVRAVPVDDPLLVGTIDLRGISFLDLYALSVRLNHWVGPDTATSWIVTNMPGNLMTVRGDQMFPPENTGLVANGFRKPENTLELDVTKITIEEVIEKTLAFQWN